MSNYLTDTDLNILVRAANSSVLSMSDAVERIIATHVAAVEAERDRLAAAVERAEAIQALCPWDQQAIDAALSDARREGEVMSTEVTPEDVEALAERVTEFVLQCVGQADPHEGVQQMLAAHGAARAAEYDAAVVASTRAARRADAEKERREKAEAERDRLAEFADHTSCVESYTSLLMERDRLAAVVERAEAVVERFTRKAKRKCRNERDVYETATLAHAAHTLRAALSDAGRGK